MRTGRDVVAEFAQVVDPSPDRGAGHAQTLGKFSSRNEPVAGAAQGGENRGVKTHKPKRRGRTKHVGRRRGSRSASCGEVQTDINGPSAMGQGADADEVDPGF